MPQILSDISTGSKQNPINFDNSERKMWYPSLSSFPPPFEIVFPKDLNYMSKSELFDTVLFFEIF